jgi:hypothetical protein
MKYQENKGKICSVPECNNIARVKGMCMGCYLKQRKEKKGEYLSLDS